MQKEVKLKIPSELWSRIEKIAHDSNRDVNDLLLDSIASSYQSFPAHPDRDAMKRELQAYEAMHENLLREHLGSYVAIFKGELIDFDCNPVDLHHRIIAKYPNQVVLSKKVETTASTILNMRSPKLEPSA